MKSVTVIRDPELRTEIHNDMPIPGYNDEQILIRVVVAGANPKDWKHPDPNYFVSLALALEYLVHTFVFPAQNSRINQGDDIAGYVHELGRHVRGFSVGDRVAAFHQIGTAGGSYAEYAVAWKHTTFHIPDDLSFGATAFTAAVGLFLNLGLPSPWERTEEKIPLLINGASSATGAFAVKLAKLNPSISPIIGTAGSSAGFVEALGIKVLDYRSPTIADDIVRALDGNTLLHVLDTANSLRSYDYLSTVLKGKGRYTFTQKMDPGSEAAFGSTVLNRIWVGTVHDDETGVGKDFGSVWAGFFARLLEGNRLEPHPYEVIPGGLEGVEGALKRLMARKEGNNKFIFRIGDTPGLEGGQE
ncbi:MAG: hypothetical protein M1813_000163 [Trichoglossum hirsutum]|nr:MAG: hypothetical protein M1813_000163 [Trichoglossum hirsutum]